MIFAASKEELRALMTHAYDNLKAGCRFIGLHANMEFTDADLAIWEKHGHRWSSDKNPLEDGCTIFTEHDVDGIPMKQSWPRLSHSLFEQVIAEVGFVDFKWIPFELDDACQDDKHSWFELVEHSFA